MAVKLITRPSYQLLAASLHIIVIVFRFNYYCKYFLWGGGGGQVLSTSVVTSLWGIIEQMNARMPHSKSDLTLNRETHTIISCVYIPSSARAQTSVHIDLKALYSTANH